MVQTDLCGTHYPKYNMSAKHNKERKCSTLYICSHSLYSIWYNLGLLQMGRILRALVNTVMKLRVPQNAGNFLTT